MPSKRTLSRREFMTTIAAGAGTVLLGNFAGAIPVHASLKEVNPLKRITLGKTGIKTTLLGIGTGFTGGKEQEVVFEALKKEGLRNQVKVIVGGGAIDQPFATGTGADGYAPTAPEAVVLVKNLIGG